MSKYRSLSISGVCDNLRHLTVISKGGLVTTDDVTKRMLLVCSDWTPADYEDAKLTIHEFLSSMQRRGMCKHVNKGIWTAVMCRSMVIKEPEKIQQIKVPPVPHQVESGHVESSQTATIAATTDDVNQTSGIPFKVDKVQSEEKADNVQYKQDKPRKLPQRRPSREVSAGVPSSLSRSTLSSRIADNASKDAGKRPTGNYCCFFCKRCFLRPLPAPPGNYTMPQLLSMLNELNEIRASKASKGSNNAPTSLKTTKDIGEGVAKTEPLTSEVSAGQEKAAQVEETDAGDVVYVCLGCRRKTKQKPENMPRVGKYTLKELLDFLDELSCGATGSKNVLVDSEKQTRP